MRQRLAGYGVFGAMLAAAGLPIYIHAPKFYVDEYGVSLAALGAVLFVLRLLDVVQDPALGWLAGRLAGARAFAVGIGVTVLGAAMLGLFAVPVPEGIPPIWWFAGMLTLLFSAFSFLNICFYAQGVVAGPSLGEQGYLRLAAWRETGALTGVSLAAVAPTVLVFTGAPFAAFAAGFAAICLLAWSLMRREWSAADMAGREIGFAPILKDRIARRLLIVALANAAPVAVSSTLFLFFVETVLEAPGYEGPLLLLFFLAAAGSSPGWSRVARRFGARPTLLAAMALSIASFAFVLTLGPGDTLAFAAICLVSGVTLGADFTLLPAMFSRRMEEIAPEAGAGFGLWSFVQKFTLAFAAVLILPALEAAGFDAGGDSTPEALQLLVLLYAGLPCALKLLAMGVLATTGVPDTRPTGNAVET